MTSIILHIANATGELDPIMGMVQVAFDKAVPIVEAELNADKVDVFVISASKQTIPEYGIGGYTPSPNHCYIYIDPISENITEEGLFEILLHEMHHCMRWRQQEYGTTLGEALVSEGLACMYEEMHRGEPPVYATVELPENYIESANSELKNTQYDHNKWFYGSSDAPNWFGYAYGYRLCKTYAVKNSKTAIDLVGVDPKIILTSHGTNFAS